MSVVVSYYAAQGLIVTPLGRPGEHEPDYELVSSSGQPVPLEEKKYAETSTSYSSWWSYWKGSLSAFYGNLHVGLPAQQRGWLAVIDGQLREWASIYGVNNGVLAVEEAFNSVGTDPRAIDTHVTDALNFLQRIGRVTNYTRVLQGKYAFYHVYY